MIHLLNNLMLCIFMSVCLFWSSIKTNTNIRFPKYKFPHLARRDNSINQLSIETLSSYFETTPRRCYLNVWMKAARGVWRAHSTGARRFDSSRSGAAGSQPRAVSRWAVGVSPAPRPHPHPSRVQVGSSCSYSGAEMQVKLLLLLLCLSPGSCKKVSSRTPKPEDRSVYRSLGRKIGEEKVCSVYSVTRESDGEDASRTFMVKRLCSGEVRERISRRLNSVLSLMLRSVDLPLSLFGTCEFHRWVSPGGSLTGEFYRWKFPANSCWREASHSRCWDGRSFFCFHFWS